MNRLIKIIISVILVAVIVVFPFMASKYINFKFDKNLKANIEASISKEKSTYDYKNMLDLANLNFEVNEKNADSAPKQSVVALWGIRDMQSILITENSEIINQNYDLSYRMARYNNNQIIKSNEISIILFYMLLSLLIIIVFGILLFIWRAELKLDRLKSF